ncbi:gas vesicle protein GvpH [Natronosalvus caseinilyticus]|uniref:gas vesicle protein GvpH n=1 Tax=Natronosalvus caseinilyticus TaxID=2953747 RepID=UPI0028AE71D9|nr:gas vesicle protein GvpH [Natronosalvus caseinilyticus]
MTDEPPDPPDSPDDPSEEPPDEPPEESSATPPNDGDDDSVSDSSQPSDQESTAGDDEVDEVNEVDEMDASEDATEDRFGESSESDEPDKSGSQPNERADRSDEREHEHEHGDERRPSSPSSRRHHSESGFEARPGGQLLSRLFRLLESGAESGTGFGGAYGNAPFGDSSRRDDGSRFRFDTDVDLTFSSIEPTGDDGRRNRRHSVHDERSSERARRHATPSIDVAKRRYGTELEVVADVSSVGEDRVRVGFEDDDLVLADDDDNELSRVSLPWPETEADATVNNGILTVRVTRVDAPGSTDGDIHE